MALKQRVDLHRGVETAFGKVIPEKEAYSFCLRTIAAFSANIFQVMRILNDDWEDRTARICETANMMNCACLLRRMEHPGTRRQGGVDRCHMGRLW